MTGPFHLWDTFRPHLRDRETPFLLIDLATVRHRYNELQDLLPEARIHYAVKANPACEVIAALKNEGSSFDVASINELDRVLSAGVEPEKISFGNTIKKEKDIAYAWNKGVKIFACDSEEELLKQSRVAPGSRIFFRITTDGSGADWPLSKKFGSHPDMVHSLALQAAKEGLEPYGLSFHVGSQQRDIGQWDNAIAHCHYLFSALKDDGIKLKMLNLGGGLPCMYQEPTRGMDVYTGEIMRYLEEHFGDDLPELFIEPGRALVGDAGMIASEVVLVSRKSKTDLVPWIYLDVGLFNGLIECLGEAIKYPLFFGRTEDNGKAKDVKAILAGPTCDSMDILYQEHLYRVPADTATGDRFYFFSAGAYTASYASVEFNGFEPIRSYFINE